MEAREKELQLARRDGYVARAVEDHKRRSPELPEGLLSIIRLNARKAFPITTTRQRVVVDSFGVSWRVTNGGLEAAATADGKFSLSPLSASRVRLLADLLNNPTESVEE